MIFVILANVPHTFSGGQYTVICENACLSRLKSLLLVALVRFEVSIVTWAIPGLGNGRYPRDRIRAHTEKMQDSRIQSCSVNSVAT